MSSAKYNVETLNRFMNLQLADNKVQLTYVWIDGTCQSLRDKSRTVSFVPKTVKDCPKWDFCGSATGFSKNSIATVQLIPCALYNDPFRGGNAKLILCDTYTDAMILVPTRANTRDQCLRVMDKVVKEFDPWFGIEQEFTLMDSNTDRPLGWPANGFPGPQGPYYCGVGAGKAIGRDIIEAHYRACLYAGLPISGINAEVMPSQWEFQVGPCSGIAAGDNVWMARYILIRVAEEFGVKVSFDPKPVNDWNGAGAHVNFSTRQSRLRDAKTRGIEALYEYIDRLQAHHEESLTKYDANGGEDNKRRLTGKHDTSDFNKFTADVGDRAASIRIPEHVLFGQAGYIEDRRPASNCDPYVVTASIVSICLINETPEPVDSFVPETPEDPEVN